MLQDEIVSYDVAKLAKEKGFQQEFDYTHFKSKWNYYNHNGELNGSVRDILKLRLMHKPIPDDMRPISAPPQSLLQRWLREEKSLHITVPFDNNEFWWQIKNLVNGHSEYGEVIGFDTYEFALEDALKYALENLF